jgi:carbamoylphosphate synthase small subunit
LWSGRNALEPAIIKAVKTLHHYLAENRAYPGIYGIDTRAITRLLRSCGGDEGNYHYGKTPQQALRRYQKHAGLQQYDS